MRSRPLLSLTALLALTACGVTTTPASTAATPSNATGTKGTALYPASVHHYSATWAVPPRADLTLAAGSRNTDTHLTLTYPLARQAQVDRLVSTLRLSVTSVVAPADAPWRATSFAVPADLSTVLLQSALQASGLFNSVEADPTIALPTDTGLATQSVKAQTISPPAALSNDPYLNKQWWLKNVNADQVTTATGKGVIVGVLDEDINRLHEDLRADGKIVPGFRPEYYDASGLNTGIPIDQPLLKVTDDHGSGSAGIIAERANNALGGRGMAPDAVIMPIDIFSGAGTASGAAQAIVWATDHGAKVLNNSWGGFGYVSVLKEAVDYALSKNVVVVASAGNDYSSYHNGPAAFTGVISVGASTGRDAAASFSSNGDRVDLYAPGDEGFTTFSGLSDGYGMFNGTSMAGPVVTGAVALLLDRAAQLNISLTPYQVKKILTQSSDRPAALNGGLRLNTQAALTLLEKGPLPGAGAHVAVQVTQPMSGELLSDMDVTLVPQSGQNKGMNYIGRTGGTYALGLADFYGIEPGRYGVQISNRPYGTTSGSGGDRVLITSSVTVSDGQNQTLQVQVPQDRFEYTSFGFFGQLIGFRNDNVPLGTYFDKWVDNSSLVAVLDHKDFGPVTVKDAPATDINDTDCYQSNVDPGMTLKIEAIDSAYGSDARAKITLYTATGTVDSFLDLNGNPEPVQYDNLGTAPDFVTACVTNDTARGGKDGPNSFYGLNINYATSVAPPVGIPLP